MELIPEMIESGIYSFKIEGRMKKPEYAAKSRFSVPEICRSLSEILRRMSGRRGSGSGVCDEEIPCPRGGSADALLDLYNRGGFHTGYYHTQNGREMISLNRPEPCRSAGSKGTC